MTSTSTLGRQDLTLEEHMKTENYREAVVERRDQGLESWYELESIRPAEQERLSHDLCLFFNQLGKTIADYGYMGFQHVWAQMRF